MQSFKNLVITILLAGLVIVGMLNFMVKTQVNNGANSTLLNNPAINKTYNSLNQKLSSSAATSQTQKQAFEQENPIIGPTSFLFTSIIGAGKTFTSLVVSVFDIAFVYLGTVLGISPVILEVFTSIVIISLILLAWRLYKLGE